MQKKSIPRRARFFTIACSIFRDFPKTGVLGTFVKTEITQSVDKIFSYKLNISEKECTVIKSSANFGYNIKILNFGITFAVSGWCRFEAKNGLKRKYKKIECWFFSENRHEQSSIIPWYPVKKSVPLAELNFPLRGFHYPYPQNPRIKKKMLIDVTKSAHPIIV